MRCQNGQVRGINIIQMIKDARLMGTDQLCGLWIAPMPGVTSEEDLGIGSDQRMDRVAQRHLIGECIHLLCFVKPNYLIGRGLVNLGPPASGSLSGKKERVTEEITGVMNGLLTSSNWIVLYERAHIRIRYMRVTEQTKRRTRERIMKAANKLFDGRGFERATTRDIAIEAGIAAGTLFNYFPSKEALAMSILMEAMEGAQTAFDAHRRGDESLEELLFARLAIVLRHLRPYRRFASQVIETAPGPGSALSGPDESRQALQNHLEVVSQLIVDHAPESSAEPSTITMHLYWTLLLGALRYWAQDASPGQHDTLVLVDQSLRLFVRGLEDCQHQSEPNDAPNHR